MRVIAVANNKGGVGKTTTTINLGAALQAMGLRVLLIDLDPQGSLTKTVGIAPASPSLADVLTDRISLAAAISRLDDYDAVPAGVTLGSVQVMLWDVPGRDLLLRTHLEALAGYDVALLDCPPNVSLFSSNAFLAASDVLIPVECEFQAMAQLPSVFQVVELVQGNVNRGLRLLGVLANKFNKRTTLHRQSLAFLHEQAAASQGRYPVLQTVIPAAIRIPEAAQAHQSILAYDPTSAAAEAYRALAQEVLGRAA